jgi:hypothetical protein
MGNIPAGMKQRSAWGTTTKNGAIPSSNKTAAHAARHERQENIMKYQVIDKQTGTVKGTYASRIRARRRADTLDNEYGAYRYYVHEIIA